MSGLVALVVSASIVFARVGAAEPSAEDLIARGLGLRRQSKPEQALESFRKAHVLAPSSRTLGQMGLVETSLEHWLDAETHLIAALATPDEGWVRKNRAFLDRALKITRGHVGELVITGPAGTSVAVDGKPVGTLPDIRSLRLAEGNAAVTASGVGFREFSKTVAIAGGARVSMAIVLDPVDQRPAVALGAPAPLAAAAPIIEDRPPSAWRTWTGTGLVAAGAGLLTWGVLWVSVDGKDHCTTGGPACTTVYDTKTPGWILAAGGAAAAAGGAILLLTSRRDHSDSDLVVAATPSSVLLSGRF